MALIGKDDALERLKPYFQAFRQAWHDAWDDWLTLSPEFRMSLCANTRAGIVHDRAIAHAVVLFGSDAHLMDLPGGLRLFVFEQAIAIRFKKFDCNLNSRNQPTSQVMAFLGQETVLGLSLSYNLELGYVLDFAQREMESIHLVCPNGGKNRYWSAELAESEVKMNVVDIFDNAERDSDVGTTKWLPKVPNDPNKVVNMFNKSKETDDPNG